MYPGAMPTVLRSGPYRFFFYSGDRDEPPHIHVERDDCEAKFWLNPVALERSRLFARKEINRIQEIIEENQQQLLDSWDEYFNG
jgi:hypothetical protein